VHYLTGLLDSVVRVSPLFPHNYVVPLLNALPVQGFFAFRIYTLSKKLLIPVLIWVLGFLRLVGTIGILVTALDMTSSDTTAIYVTRWEWIFTTDFSLGVVNDVIITATLVLWLYRQRRDAYRRYVH
jgi:uncharacterized membrane protein YedE/YeeE